MGWDNSSIPLSSISPSRHAWGVPSITSCHWLQEDMDELCERAEARSRPPHHHGNGPYNDVNIPGCWFFKLPHKVSW